MIFLVVAAALDSGAYTLSMNGTPIGQETFSITQKNGGLETEFKSTLSIAGMKIEQQGTLRTDAAWHPQSGEFSAKMSGQAAKLSLRRGKDGLLELETTPAGKPPTTTKAQKPVDLFVGNNMIAPLSALCALAGPTEKTLTALPGMSIQLQPVKRRSFPVERLGVESQSELAFIVADLAMSMRLEVLCDGPKLVALWQPLPGVLAVRAGWEKTGAALAAPTRKKPPLPESLSEQPRTVKSDGAQLACSLVEPKAAKGKLPAVVFITGSGAQDRDEDTPGPGGLKMSIFKVLAIALGEAGIASLRCDDRGTGNSTGELASATLETLAGDVRAEVAALRAEPRIDPARIGLIGHSEGGTIAPIVAATDARIRAIVLMAGTGRPLDQIILEQEERSLRASGLSDEDVRKELARSHRTFAAIKDGKPLPADLTPRERQGLDKAAPWLRSHFLHDPAAELARVKCAVLIAQGGKDRQVAVKDAEALHAADPHAVYKLYPDLNHLFARTKSGSMADYSDPNAKVDEGFLSDVVAFLREKLGR